MKKSVIERVENLESFISARDKMSLEEMEARLRELYSKRVGADHTLTIEEYEAAILAEFPEVLKMKTGLPITKLAKDSAEMTEGERKDAIDNCLRRTAWKIAFSRGMICH